MLPLYASVLRTVDADRGLVAGVVLREETLHDGTRWSYRHGADLVREWAAQSLAKSGGDSMGPVLEMHRGEPIGKVLTLAFDDDDKSITAVLQIDSEAALRKIEAGVLTGLSVGGYRERTWSGTIDGREVTRFTSEPTEISLVDRPKIESAQITRFAKRAPASDIALHVGDALVIARADELRWERQFARCRPNPFV